MNDPSLCRGLKAEVKGKEQRSRSKVNLKVNVWHILVDFILVIHVQGRGHWSGSKVEVKGQCQGQMVSIKGAFIKYYLGVGDLAMEIR